MNTEKEKKIRSSSILIPLWPWNKVKVIKADVNLHSTETNHLHKHVLCQKPSFSSHECLHYFTMEQTPPAPPQKK